MTRVTFPLLLLALLAPGRASAQGSDADKSAAQSLFERAKVLMSQGNYDEACPKLAESLRLDPGGGTILNLALCHEQQGRVATAWSEFKEALSAAKRDNRQDRLAAATDHIAALEPQLPWLVVIVTSPVDGQVVKLDNAPTGSALWGTPIAIDPGVHDLNASAPSRLPWTTSLSIIAGERKTVEIPQLSPDPALAAAAPAPPVAAPAAPVASPSPAPPPAPPVAPPPPAESNSGGGSTVGWVLGGAGVAAIAVGSVFGLQALDQKSKSDRECPTDETCTGRGVSLNDDANTSAWIANVGIGLGLLGVGVGTYLVVSGSSSSNGATRGPHVALSLRGSPHGGQLGLNGSF